MSRLAGATDEADLGALRALTVEPQAAAARAATRPRPVSSPGRFEAEMVRLHHQIVALRPNEPLRSLMFIGSREGEGASTIAREFARVSAAHFGQHVLLLVSGTPATDAAADSADDDRAPEPAGGTTLVVAPLPLELTAPSHAMSAPGVTAVWERLQQTRDLVVVDAPPATRSPEGLAMARLVDGVVLVVEADSTRWPVAARTQESIVRSGGRVIGIVFNKRRFYIPAFLYDYL